MGAGRKGSAVHAPKGLKKHNNKLPKVPSTGLSKAEILARAPGLSSGNAGSFLKDRQNKKVRELRCADALSALDDVKRRAEDFEQKQEEELDNQDSAEANVNPHREAENT